MTTDAADAAGGGGEEGWQGGVGDRCHVDTLVKFVAALTMLL